MLSFKNYFYEVPNEMCQNCGHRDTKNAERSGRPNEAVIQENIKQVRLLLQI